MITVAALLLVVALGLLVGGLLEGSAALQWGSFAASVLAALVLLLGEVRQRRARGRSAARHDPPTTGGARAAAPATPPGGYQAPPVRWTPAPTPVADPEPPVRRVSPPPVPPSSPAIPRVVAPASRPETGGQPAAGTSAWPAAPASDSFRQPGAPAATSAADGAPPVEVVEFSDVLMSMDLADDVLVVGGHPRYHLARCPYLAGEAPVPLPLNRARAEGFNPCGTCTPDRTLAARERARRGC